MPSRDRAVARVLWIVLFCNIFVSLTKLGVSLATGALAVFADGIHGLLDASSNLVGLLGIAMGSRPPDAGHPYGHRRFETLAAVVIGLFILLGMVEILHGLLDGLRGHRAAPVVTVGAAVVLALTVVGNVLTSRFEKRRGVELRSGLLSADASHTFTDGLGTLSVLLSFGAVALGFAFADLVAAAVVTVLIAYTAVEVLRTNIGALMDNVRLDPQKVRGVAMSVPGVKGAHKIRSRGSQDFIQVDLHIHLDPQWTVTQAHAATHQVADAVKAAFPGVSDVVIHTEPADGRENDISTISPGSKAPERIV